MILKPLKAILKSLKSIRVVPFILYINKKEPVSHKKHIFHGCACHGCEILNFKINHED